MKRTTYLRGILSQIRRFHAKFRMYYHTVPPQTVHFQCNRKQGKKGALPSCARSNLRLLNFNIQECQPLQAYLNVETPLSLIFAPLVPARLGVTGHRMVNILLSTTSNHVVPAQTRTNHVFKRCFSPGCKHTRIAY